MRLCRISKLKCSNTIFSVALIISHILYTQNYGEKAGTSLPPHRFTHNSTVLK